MVDRDREWNELPIAELEQLDAVCVRFDQALAHDPETRIESFVDDLTEPQQRLVVLELVQVEIERRHARGQRPAPDEYAVRFPRWADELQTLAAQSIEDLDRAGIAGAQPDTVNEHAATDDHTKSESAKSLPPARAGTSESRASWADQRRALTSGLSWADLPEDGMLGHYQLQSVIGRGGMGIVVRAHDTKLARDVAIKIPAQEISRDARAKERFLREARAVASLRHNHAVTIHAVEHLDHIPFLVMELVEGTTLEHYLHDSETLVAGEVIGLACQIARGLAAAHKQGLIHRDVKPANILLEKVDQHGSGLPQQATWHVKITDFGLARVAADARLTNSGLIAGTPQYMSPEQAEGKELDVRSDLFSLGSVMYAMCAGSPPFEAESAVCILRKVADRPARPLREVSPGTPGWLIAIIEKLMAKSPDERFQSAVEVAELLGRHAHDLQMGWTATDSANIESPAAGVPTRLRGRTKMLTALAIISFAVLAFGVVRSVRTNTGDEAADVRAPRVEQAEVNTAAQANVHPSWHGWPADAPAPAIAPFDAEQAKRHQEVWAKYLDIPVETDNSIDMKMVLIPPGEFLMGGTDKEIEQLVANSYEAYQQLWRSEGPQHRVAITQPFLLSTCEVTRGQFRAFVEDSTYKTDAEQDGKGGFGRQDGEMLQDPRFIWSADPGFAQRDDHPVVNVSWNDATKFCEWLSKREGTAYRLPSEAGWEYACRAGTTTSWHCTASTELLPEYAWLGRRFDGQTHPVGGLKPNPWSLYDMHGNVWEWCADQFDSGYYGRSPEVDPPGPVLFSYRVTRGGSWNYPAEFCRSTIRFGESPDTRTAHIGFRVAASLRPN